MGEWKNGYKGGVTEKSVHLPCALFSVTPMMPVKDIDTCLTLAMRNSNVEQLLIICKFIILFTFQCGTTDTIKVYNKSVNKCKK